MVVTLESLGPLVRSAREAGRDVSLIFGLGPNPGALFLRPEISPHERLHELAIAPRRLFLGLFREEEAPQIPGHPENLVLVRATPEETAQAVGEPFAVEAISIGAYGTEELDLSALALLRGMLLPHGSLSLYMMSDVESRDHPRLLNRIPRAGFGIPTVERFEHGGDLDPLPHWPRPLKSLVSARVRPYNRFTIDESDVLVQALRSLAPEEYPEAAVALAAWIRTRLPEPIRVEGDHDQIALFSARYLRSFKDPILDGRATPVAKATRAALARFKRLFPERSSHQRIDQRRPIVAALAQEFFKHHQPPFSYQEVWSWLEEVTGLPVVLFRNNHEDDVRPVLLARSADFLSVSREEIDPNYHLSVDEAARMVDRFLTDCERKVSVAEIFAELQRLTGVGDSSLRRRFGTAPLTAIFWRNRGRLDPESVGALRTNLLRDPDLLAASGIDPAELEQAEVARSATTVRVDEEARLMAEVARWVDSLERPPRPLETAGSLHEHLARAGIQIYLPQLTGMWHRLAKILWDGVDAGKIDPRFLEKIARVRRLPPPGSVPAEVAAPAAPPISLDQLPPVIRDPREMAAVMALAATQARNVSFVFGLGPGGTHQHLGRFFGEGVRRNFLGVGLVRGTPPEIANHPGNLTFFDPNGTDLREAIPFASVAEVLSFGTYSARDLGRAEFRWLRRMIRPEGVISLWLPPSGDLMEFAGLMARMEVEGFERPTILEAMETPEWSLLRDAPTPPAKFVTARVR